MTTPGLQRTDGPTPRRSRLPRASTSQETPITDVWVCREDRLSQGHAGSDLDLEADLGVDTVKQAETVRRRAGDVRHPARRKPEIARFPNAGPRDPFAHENRGDHVPEPAPTTQHPEPATFDAANTVPRRVPVPTLRPPLALCKPTGVNARRPARACSSRPTRSADAWPRSPKASTVALNSPDASVDSYSRMAAAGPVQGVYWLPALDHRRRLSANGPRRLA